jgi:hypothetical protein
MNFKGFDSKLIDVYNPIGVSFNSTVLTLSSNGSAVPFVTTVTSPASVSIDFDATIIKQVEEVNPIGISIWAIQNGSFPVIDAFYLYFSYPSNKIIYSIEDSNVTQPPVDVGNYAFNSSYHIQISFTDSSNIEFTIDNSTWSLTPIVINNASILQDSMVNLSFFAEPLSAGAQSVAVVQNYNVNLPNQPYLAILLIFWAVI